MNLRTLLALCFLAPHVYGQPVSLIYDTDMGNDVDDALALAIIHSFANRGEADLLAVTVTKDNRWSAPYVDVLNTFYGRPDVPIGVVKEGMTPDDAAMTRVPADRRDADGNHVYPHDLVDGREAPEAVGVLRRALAGAADSSVIMVQVGFSTNLARLLDSSPDEHSELTGQELVTRKVRLLSIMAGEYQGGDPEYNVRVDIPSAQKIFSEWPTDVVASGYEIGIAIPYPAASIERHYGYVDHHPVADAYRNYLEMPYDRPTWDLTSVLYAVRPDDGYFGLSESGRIHVEEDGRTRFELRPDGRHRYLTVDEIQKHRVTEALIYLASEPQQQSPETR